jgi:hypothetical protein
MRLLLLIILSVFLACEEKREEPAPVEPDRPPPPLADGEEPEIPPPARASNGGLVSFDKQESDILEVLELVNRSERFNTRFLTICEQINGGVTDLDPYIKAVDKTLNSLSTERQITATNSAGSSGCVRSFDLRDYNLTPEKWALFRARLNETFGRTFESFTTRGLLIKQLTQSMQAAIPAHIFMFLALNQPLYAQFLELADTEPQLEIDLGVNIQNNFDIEDPDTYLACKSQSPITLQKPRCMIATESDDGFYYKTYDILLANVGQRQTNPFESPFPVEARSERTLIHDGSESIFSLRNGLIGYYLAGADGARIDEAPTDLVEDPASSAKGLGNVINYLSCHKCHAQAIEDFRDEVASKVANDTNFDVIDQQKVAFWHGRSLALNARINQDQSQYFDALRRIGIGTNEPDPINEYTDTLRQSSSLEQVAALMSQKPEDFAASLRATNQAQSELGQLLNGDRVPLDQLQRSLQVYVVEANIFRDDFGD